MITTGCEECCFLKMGDKGKFCALNQLCVLRKEEILAPGYCRMCRSHKWEKKQGEVSLKQLCQNVVEERVVKFDMLIFFDEAHHSIEDLERTLKSDWYTDYAQKVIIMDVTGFGDRKNLAFQYVKNNEHPVPTVIDSSVVHEPLNNREDTIRRISKQVTAPFFLVLPAGGRIRNFELFAKMVQHVPHRVIHWSFPFNMGSTQIIPYTLCYGLFITIPYKILTQSHNVKSFTEQLKIEETETEMGLSMLCMEACLI